MRRQFTLRTWFVVVVYVAALTSLAKTLVYYFVQWGYHP